MLGVRGFMGPAGALECSPGGITAPTFCFFLWVGGVGEVGGMRCLKIHCATLPVAVLQVGRR